MSAPKSRVAEAPKQPRSSGRLIVPVNRAFKAAMARSPAKAPAPDKQTCTAKFVDSLAADSMHRS